MDDSLFQDVGDNTHQYFKEDHSRTFVKDKPYVLPVDQEEIKVSLSQPFSVSYLLIPKRLKRSEHHHRLCQFMFSGRNYVGPVKEALQFGQRRRSMLLAHRIIRSFGL